MPRKLIDFDDTVDFSDEPEAGHESDGAGEEEKQEDHYKGVSEVEEGRGGVLYVELGDEVVAAVDEQVAGRGARAEEGAPPPVVVLRAQVEVTQQDRRLRARDHQDHEHKEQESEHVVHLTGPKRVENKEQLNEDASKWQYTTHHDAGNGLCV